MGAWAASMLGIGVQESSLMWWWRVGSCFVLRSGRPPMELIFGGHVIYVIARDLPENPIGDVTRNRYKIGVYPDFKSGYTLISIGVYPDLKSGYTPISHFNVGYTPILYLFLVKSADRIFW